MPGHVFFTDQPNDKIWKYGTDGKLSVFLSPAGRANGWYFDAQGRLIACADVQNELWASSPQAPPDLLFSSINSGFRLAYFCEAAQASIFFSSTASGIEPSCKIASWKALSENLLPSCCSYFVRSSRIFRAPILYPSAWPGIAM